MTADDVLDLISKGEGLTVEFKRELNRTQARNIGKTIAAFASSDGGVILLGIDDDGTVVGLRNAAEESRRLANIVAQNVEPDPVVEMEIVRVDKTDVLVVQVRQGAATIFSYDRRPMIRVGSSSFPATMAQIDERRSGVHTQLAGIQHALAQIPRPEQSTAAALASQGELVY